MVASELSDDAGEARATVGEEDLGLRVAARVDQDLARGREAGVVLEADTHIEVPQGYPGRLPAPADVDDLVPERQEPLEGFAGLGSLLPLPAGRELKGAGRNAQITHCVLLSPEQSRQGLVLSCPATATGLPVPRRSFPRGKRSSRAGSCGRRALGTCHPRTGSSCGDREDRRPAEGS